jgi:ribosome-associated toxin RatA of RatAB toxin-antitoxin module
VREVTVRVFADGRTASEAYRLITDFRRYPELTDKVSEVVVHPPEPDGSLLSEWSVRFRNGLMRWTERDTFSPETLTVTFEQTSGDFEVFRGSWACAPHGNGTVVTFAAAFDMGMPTLAEILDPVAESTLRENITRILDGLLGGVVPIELVETSHG